MTTVNETPAAPDVDVEAIKRERAMDYYPFVAVDLDENLERLRKRRELSPLTYSTDGGFWVATGYDEVVNVLRNNNKGFVSFPNNPYGLEFGPNLPVQKQLIPIDLDGPLHRQWRKILEPVFSPNQMNALEPQIRTLANTLIDNWIESGSVDFVPEFAFPFSATTVILLMGWPLEDAELMNGWVRTLQHGVTNGSQEETQKAQAAAAGECREYIFQLIADRRGKPGDDFTHMLMEVELNGEKLTDDDLFDTFLLMMMAGLDTVQSVLAQIFQFLGQNQDKWGEIFADEETIDLAVEELLRWTAPAPPTRNVTNDFMMVGDVPVPKGERVHCAIGAANRDPKYYPNPDEVDYHRDAKPHLAFGLGPHRCIGIHLARLEIKIALQELYKRMPEFALDPSVKPVGHLGFAWGVEDVHLTFPPGSRQSA